ncbi:MAG: anaerobic C4-dicarboxylate transporter [Candidatus Nanopelagicales bacterium]
MIAQFVVVLGAIWLGARAGGMGLGLWGGVGLFVLVVVFHAKPTAPPIDVMLIILAVICAAAAMEAAGGIAYLVGIAESLIRRWPSRVTIVAPLVAYLFTFGAGTGHIFYPLLPVIHDTAYNNGIRPERPIAVSTIASQQAITASPVSAAMAALIVILEPTGMTLIKIMAIAIPGTIAGVVVAALFSMRRGAELADDPVFQQRLRDGLIEPPLNYDLETRQVIQRVPRPTPAPGSMAAIAEHAEAEAVEHPASAKRSAMMFLIGVLFIVTIGAFQDLRPSWDGERLSMSVAIQIVMLTVAALIVTLNKVSVGEIPRTPVAQAGFVALVGIFGLAWMGDTFVAANEETIIGSLTRMAEAQPWTFSIGLFFASVLLFSQAATTRVLMPIGLALGIGGPALTAMWPAVNGYFFLPTYGTVIAAINFDRSGTTRIGKYVLNHSFMLPGLISTVTAVTVGLALSTLF